MPVAVVASSSAFVNASVAAIACGDPSPKSLTASIALILAAAIASVLSFATDSNVASLSVQPCASFSASANEVVFPAKVSFLSISFCFASLKSFVASWTSSILPSSVFKAPARVCIPSVIVPMIVHNGPSLSTTQPKASASNFRFAPIMTPASSNNCIIVMPPLILSKASPIFSFSGPKAGAN